MSGSQKMTRPAVEIIQFQKRHEAKFVCSACGADRGCDCNAPAVEKLAEIKERERLRVRDAVRKHREHKRKQGAVTVTDQEMPTEQEANESWQDDLYDQACFLLEQMGSATRQKLFAYMRRIYANEIE